MKTETYCTSADCMQWRALHAESADGLLASDVCNNAAWPVADAAGMHSLVLQGDAAHV